MTPPAAKRLADLGRVPVTFGELLVCIRRDEGLSRDAFAHRLGVSRTNLWYIERRRKAITPQQAACWARQLGYDQAQFVQLALQSLVAEAGRMRDYRLWSAGRSGRASRRNSALRGHVTQPPSDKR